MSAVVTKKEIDSKVKNKNQIKIGANCKLTLADAKLLATRLVEVKIDNHAHQAIEHSYQFLKSQIDQRIPIYGTNTNFGDQVAYVNENLKHDDSAIYYASINRQQKNIVKSLACSLGPIVTPDIIRVTIMLRAHCLSQGYSGVTPTTLEAMLNFLNAGITPVVGCYGSIGASGDLIPLASIAAGMMGESVDVLYQNEVMPAPYALNLAGLQKLNPDLRDGLALINGTSFMTAIASLTLHDMKRLFFQMLSAIAMSLESMLVISSAYEPLVHQLKYHTGSQSVNDFILNFWDGSQLLTDLGKILSGEESSRSVQDYYSLRAVPQGFGVFMENLDRATLWVENEMNAVNDNPIIDFHQKKIYHNANFMGYYITDACDMLKMDIAQASTWLHALIANMVHPRKNHNLPTNIVKNPHKNNGFRSMQLLAAALAVQNRKLAQSHASFMLPTEGDNQDVNSLGTHAALDFQQAFNNLEKLTAILLLASAQALEFRDIRKAGFQSQRIHQIIREYSSTIEECRPMSNEINSIVNLLKEEKI